MIIEEKDFRLIPIDEHSVKFDLELLYTIRPKGKEARQEFKNAGYGMSLENALMQVAEYRITQKYPENISLKDYIREFKQQVESIKQLV